MIHWIKNNKTVIKAVFIISLLIPTVIVTYQVIFTGKDSVTLSINSEIGIILLMYYILLIVLIVIAIGYWFLKQLKAIVTLKNENTKAELMHLKAQVNPHFFFNMLNNLYGLVEKDTNKAKELILKLSEMMRYSIYEGEKEYVTLEEEIDFIKNFLMLHEMRYHKKIDIKFEIDTDNSTERIAPLLFIILVENAFKHGVESLTEKAFVHINLKSVNKEVRFKIENNFEAEEQKTKGLGLKNLARRLELIYPTQHKVTTVINKKIYSTQLTLKL